jgi:TPR repeat protein
MRSAQVTHVNCYVAKALINGDGVAQDSVLAVEWYEKAAARGCALSQYDLGEKYFYGKGVDQDFERAVAEYRLAAEEEGEGGGHSAAQMSLGFCYYHGHEVEKDDIIAREWYKKAALQGNPAGVYNAAQMCRDGEGGELDYKDAARMFRQLAEHGHGQAQNHLGHMYHKGEGVAQDGTQAVAWFIK